MSTIFREVTISGLVRTPLSLKFETGGVLGTSTEVLNPLKLESVAGASVTLSGTITTATEADIVAGGRTIVLTLTSDTWITAGVLFDAQRSAIIMGLDSAQAEALGWDNTVKILQGVAGVVRTSNTVVTITLDARPTYSITANETITATVPASALTGGVALVASPTFTVTDSGITVALTGISSTVSQGNLTASLNAALNGVSQSISTGNLVASLSRLLSGNAETQSTGNISVSNTKALSGLAEALSAGSLIATNNIPLSTLLETIAQGNVSPSGDVNIQLTGAQYAMLTGSVTASNVRSITGQVETIVQGALTGTLASIINGNVNTFTQGNVVSEQNKALTGNIESITQGTVTPSLETQVQLTGQSVTVSQGTLASNIVKALLSNVSSLNTGTLSVFGTVHHQYPLAGIDQNRPITATQIRSITVAQARPITNKQGYPLAGSEQDYPL